MTEAQTVDMEFNNVKQFLDDEINPIIASHGGYFELKEIKDNKIYVEMGGGCQGCGMANVTLQQGVERMMKDAFPEMEELVDMTDHGAGTDPYYQSSK